MSAVRVEGLTQLARSISAANAELDMFMREGLLGIAEDVGQQIRPPYAQYSEKGAGMIRAKVTGKGAAVVAQTLRKSRGLRQRRNFGPLMYRKAFAPGLQKGEPKAQAAVDVLFTKIRREWDA